MPLTAGVEVKGRPDLVGGGREGGREGGTCEVRG